MSLFDRLFSRGPKLPDPVYDPFGGDLATRRVVEGLKRGDWKEADELLARTRKGDDRAAKAGRSSWSRRQRIIRSPFPRRSSRST